MIIRKHTTRQHNLPIIAKSSSCRAISKVPKLFEHHTQTYKCTALAFFKNVKIKMKYFFFNRTVTNLAAWTAQLIQPRSTDWTVGI
jgi:hypothetical protein